MSDLFSDYKYQAQVSYKGRYLEKLFFNKLVDFCGELDVEHCQKIGQECKRGGEKQFSQNDYHEDNFAQINFKMSQGVFCSTLMSPSVPPYTSLSHS